MPYNKSPHVSASVPLNPTDFKITFTPKKKRYNKARQYLAAQQPRDPCTGILLITLVYISVDWD